MSLESIYRVVSNALKAAAAVDTGTAEEKAAMNVLGGLSAMLEARVQLHKHDATAAPAAASPTAKPAVAAPAPVPTGFQKQRKPIESGDSYDLK